MKIPPFVSRFVSDYGMVFVLLLLCAFFSWATWAEQHPSGAEAARDVAGRLGPPGRILIAVGTSREDAEFAGLLKESLRGWTVVGTVHGEPRDARRALAAAGPVEAIACSSASAGWEVFRGNERVVAPRTYSWPNFLKRDNLLNVANQIAVIAILAVGMTLVIITGGIDLSAGSLIAVASTVAARLIRDAGGGEEAGVLAVVLSCAAGLAVCSAVGLFSGSMVTYFAVPPFIVTLAMMLVASGLAFIGARGQTIEQVPPGFVALGWGKAFGVPNAVLLMLGLYAAAHVLMSRTALGRYLYAVGGNVEAARLSGVPVRRVLLFAYTACGATAGLGGIVLASTLKSGAPTYGLMYELYAIAAVVVGGTSLAGGEGRVLGTLIGAFIIAVIQNGMNLTGIESYTQKVVLGLVILGAVLLDNLKRRGWEILRKSG